MKRHLKFLLLAAVLIVTAFVADPPPSNIPNPMGKRPPIPGNPPVIVVTPNNK